MIVKEHTSVTDTSISRLEKVLSGMERLWAHQYLLAGDFERSAATLILACQACPTRHLENT